MSKLYSKRLRFEEVLKVVEKYWEAGPGSICVSCVGVGHNCLAKYRNRAIQYVTYTRFHKIENYRCGVKSYMVKIYKICP